MFPSDKQLKLSTRSKQPVIRLKDTNTAESFLKKTDSNIIRVKKICTARIEFYCTNKNSRPRKRYCSEQVIPW